MDIIKEQFKEYFNTKNLSDIIIDYVIKYSVKLVIGLIVYFIGAKIIKYIIKLMDKFFEKSRLDISLRKFLISFSRLGLKILLILMVMGILGIPSSPFVALIGAAGLGIGLALQGGIGNFTGGILILTLRPFSVGDYILSQAFDKEGTVEDIQVFYTIIRTKDNKIVTIPNGELSNNGIVNYTAMDTRRVDLKFGVDYSEDVMKVKNAILTVIKNQGQVLLDKEPFVNISEHGDSAVIFDVFVWCRTENYLNVRYDLIEQVKLKFDEENISIPYPHLDVNLTNK
jgi:small conductance mechanosensitive channel